MSIRIINLEGPMFINVLGKGNVILSNLSVY